MLLNALYLLALSLLSPWLLWRRVRTGRYRSGLREKLLGEVSVQNNSQKPVVWFHGVSVGEIHLLTTVIAAFRKRHPDWLIVVSSTTDTGLAEARSRFADLIVISWPFDFSWAVRRAMRIVNPKLLVLAEGELWPNTLQAAKEHGAKVAVINARMSPRSFSRSQRVAGLLRWFVYQYVDCFAVQSEEYRERFLKLGIPSEKVKVTGSVKYDGALGDRFTSKSLELRRLLDLSPSPLGGEGLGVRGGPVGKLSIPLTQDKPVIWVAGSTHAPEEQIILTAFTNLRPRFPNLHLILVPRHPDRFEEVTSLTVTTGHSFIRRSQISEPLTELLPIILLDSVGELGAAWLLADIGYVGGTLDGKRGGQSMIEPAGFGVPSVFGPNYWNFKDAANRLIDAGGAICVKSPDELESAIVTLLSDPEKRAKMGESARQLVIRQQGATARTLDVLDDLMDTKKPISAAA